MEMIKREVVDRNLTDKEQIIEAIRRIAGELGVSLSDRDVERIASMMSRLQELDLRLDDMEKQLHQISRQCQPTC